MARIFELSLFLALSSALAPLRADVVGTLSYDYPVMGTPYETETFNSVPTTLVTLTSGPDISNLISGDSVNITFGNMASQNLSFAPTSFNGEVFNFQNLNIADVVYSSNFVTEPADWGYSANEVWVNFAGLTPTTDSYVNFSFVDPPVPAPEPGTLSLTLAGLAAMMVFVLRHRRSA